MQWDIRFGMIVSTHINIAIGKKGKPVGPLQVMGYDESEGGTPPPTKEQSAMEMALRFRLASAMGKRSNKNQARGRPRPERLSRKPR